MIFWHQQGTPSGAKVTSENETSALGRRSQTPMSLLRTPEGKGGEFKLTRSPDRRVVCRLGLKKIFFLLGACVERAEGHQRPFFLELFSRRTQEGRQTSRASASYLVVNYVVLTALRNASVVPPLGQITLESVIVTTERARSGGCADDGAVKRETTTGEGLLSWNK